MSDRVENFLKIVGERTRLEEFKTKAVGQLPTYTDDQSQEEQFICCDCFLPVPTYLRSRTRWGYAEAEQEGIARTDPRTSPFRQHANNSGGTWEDQTWAVKYGPINGSPGKLDDQGRLCYWFETRNAVAVEAFIGISTQYPDLIFNLYWEAEWAWETYHLFAFKAGHIVKDIVLDPEVTNCGLYTAALDKEAEFRIPEWDQLKKEIAELPYTPAF